MQSSDAPILSISAVQAEAARRCKNSLAFFVRQFWNVVVPNDLVWNWHMEVLCDEVQRVDELVFKREAKEHDLIINVPPGTSKTKIVSVMATAWEFARKPDLRIFVGSYSDTAILGISDEIRIIMRSEKYRTYFPDVEIRKGKDSILLYFEFLLPFVSVDLHFKEQ